MSGWVTGIVKRWVEIVVNKTMVTMELVRMAEEN